MKYEKDGFLSYLDYNFIRSCFFPGGLYLSNKRKQGAFFDFCRP